MDDQDNSPTLGANAPAASPPSVSPHHDMLADMHKAAMAKYNSIAKAHELAEEIREELDELVSKGEAISDEDVLDSMARLVGKGADPQQLGALMAGGNGQPPMPQGGPGLAQWAQNMDQMLTQKEEALAAPMAAARMEALASAVHLLIAHHVHGAAGPQPGVSSHAGRSDGRSQLGATSPAPAGAAEPSGSSLGVS